MVHIGDRVRAIATGHLGTVIDVTDKRVKVRFPAGRSGETVAYSLGEITGQPGYVQYAEITRCPHASGNEV